MKPRYFTLPLTYLGCLWCLLGSLSAPAAQARSFYYNRIAFNYQVTKDYKPDGSIVSAEFIFEATLLPDGRANGGWGIWERGTPDVLTLYRVVEGRVSSDNRSNGPFFEFKSQRLSPLPGDEITISLRPAAGQVPTGTVTFIVDGIPSATGEPLSFAARGRVLPASPTVTDLVIDRFNYINAPPQTVVVQTLSGSYTASFENVALVLPSGGAIGLLALAGPDGRLQNFHVMAGETQFRNGVAGRVLLRARPVDAAGSTRSPSPLPVLIVIADQRDFSEPCRIYDILGTQVNVPLRFEAQASFTIF